MITVLTIGKKHESWISEGLNRYEKRLKTPFNIEWVLLPHSSYTGDRARQNESQTLLSRIHPTDYIILLDEKGINSDSPALSKKITAQLDHSRRVVIIIGGAYGVNAEVQSRANFVWSLSNLVFPHQLVRLLLIEQLYRAQEIFRGGRYHHT